MSYAVYWYFLEDSKKAKKKNVKGDKTKKKIKSKSVVTPPNPEGLKLEKKLSAPLLMADDIPEEKEVIGPSKSVYDVGDTEKTEKISALSVPCIDRDDGEKDETTQSPVVYEDGPCKVHNYGEWEKALISLQYWFPYKYFVIILKKHAIICSL